MTAEHISESQMARYCGRTLGPHELLAVDRHLASCDTCHEHLSRLLPSVLNRPEPPPALGDEHFHLDYDEHLAPYVDGTADEIDREIIESHIAYCSACAGDLRDLEEFRRQPVQTPTRDRSTSTPPTSPLSGTWAAPRWVGLRPATALGIAALFLVAAAWLWWMTRPTGSTVERAAHPPAPVERREEPTPEPHVSPPAEAGLATAPSPTSSPRKAQGTAPAVALNDGGGQVILDGSGHVAGLGPLPRDLERVLETALTMQRLERPPALVALSEGSGRVRGGDAGQDETFSLLEPAGLVVESDRPTFSWRALEGASSYIVTVYDLEGRRVESSEPLTAKEWSAPRPLERGLTYVWQVSATRDGKTIISPKPPAPEARFKVLSRDAAAALQRARKAHASSHLAMGVWYWREGLLAEAEREFEALARANPNSAAASGLLASVRSLRRR